MELGLFTLCLCLSPVSTRLPHEVGQHSPYSDLAINIAEKDEFTQLESLERFCIESERDDGRM